MGHQLSFLRRSARGLVSLGLATACTTSSNTDKAARPPASIQETERDASLVKLDSVSIRLGATVLEPGESTEVRIEVAPAGVHPVRLALLDGANDAYLDDPLLTTDTRGVAQTRLTVVAHNKDQLTLQALAGDQSEKTRIGIRERSIGQLAVAPLYSGDRTFAAWDVLWLTDKSCDLSYDDPAWKDAHPSDVTFVPDGGAPEYTFEGVPARLPLTLFVKAERFAYGCVSGVQLTPQTSTRVEVPINQRFADVSQLSLRVEINIAPESEFWSTLLVPQSAASYIENLTSKFRGSATSDVDALLTSMQALSSSPTLFEAARADGSWDAVLTDKLSPEGAQYGLTSRVSRWLQDGAKLLQSPRAFLANLRYHSDANRGELELVSVAGKTPNDCRMPEVHLASIAIDAQDVLRVGFHLRYLPSTLLTCLADTAVTSGEDAAVADVPSALLADFDCARVAAWLGSESNQLFQDCDVACGRQLCEAALGKLWQQVVEGDLTESSLEVNAAGKALLSDDAHVTGVDANWVGTTTLANITSSVSGSLKSCDIDADYQSAWPP